MSLMMRDYKIYKVSVSYEVNSCIGIDDIEYRSWVPQKQEFNIVAMSEARAKLHVEERSASSIIRNLVIKNVTEEKINAFLMDITE